MHIPLPIFKFVNVTIFPDTFWGGITFVWLLSGVILFVITASSMKGDNERISLYKWLNLLFVFLVISPFGVHLAFETYREEVEQMKTHICDLEAQLKKKKK